MGLRDVRSIIGFCGILSSTLLLTRKTLMTMPSFMIGWIGILALAAPGPGDRGARPEVVTIAGQVVELAEALKAKGLKVDSEPVARQVAIVADDGSITPLLSDDASRALFVDEALRHRRAEIRGKRFPGLPYLQVLSFKVDDQGKLRTPEYFCEVCSISSRYPQTCPCCQGPMPLRMKPEEP